MSSRSMLVACLAFLIFASGNCLALAFEIDPTELPSCGSVNTPPFAAIRDTGPRACLAPVDRGYRPRHKGLGFEILNSESAACFVPDQSFRLLDEIIDSVSTRVKYDGKLKTRQARIDQARLISKTISDVLRARGFGLHIPTNGLSDALVERNAAGETERHIFDCDTGSLIFLTVAENLGAPVSMVDIDLPSGSGHNYVRWAIDDKTSFDWDLNGQDECASPDNLPSYQGKSMKRSQVIGYAKTLRTKMWEAQKLFEKAIPDYEEAMKLYPEAPVAFNNFAWMIATKEFPRRKELRERGLTAALRVISIARTANYLDTLSCSYAYVGSFEKALEYQREAVAKDPGNAGFARRLSFFTRQPPTDCTGEE